jgi:hypothetical protein
MTTPEDTHRIAAALTQWRDGERARLLDIRLARSVAARHATSEAVAVAVA